MEIMAYVVGTDVALSIREGDIFMLVILPYEDVELMVAGWNNGHRELSAGMDPELALNGLDATIRWKHGPVATVKGSDKIIRELARVI